MRCVPWIDKQTNVITLAVSSWAHDRPDPNQPGTARLSTNGDSGVNGVVLCRCVADGAECDS